MTKSIFASKVFWFNVTSGAVALASGQMGVNIPAKYAVPVLTIGNILLRFLSNQPVTL